MPLLRLQGYLSEKKAMNDPNYHNEEETHEGRKKWTTINGKKVMWDRIHEATGRNRVGVEKERFVRKRGFDALGGLLQSSVKKHGLAARVGKSMVLELFRAEVMSRIPKEMHDRFRALSITHGILTVACLSSGVAFTIRKHERELLEILKKAGADIKSLRTILSTWR